MSKIIVALGGLLLLITVTEILWRRKLLAPETARKLIHVVGGVSVAFWPYFMSFRTVQLLSLGLLIGIFTSYRLRILGSIHSVRRSTRGELIYPIGIGACAFLAHEPWIFTAAVMHLAIADGLAAVLGTKWGKKTHYQFGPQHKSLVGTGVFFIVSLLIITISYGLLGGQQLIDVSTLSLLSIATLATIVENISPYGLDNLTVPLAVVLALTQI